jgi:poly(hydroxyalkanoate) depolymerase family esterase
LKNPQLKESIQAKEVDLKTDAQMIQQMLAATDLTREGRLAEATALIQRVLAGQGASGATAAGAQRHAADDVIDVDSVEVADSAERGAAALEATPEAEKAAARAATKVSFDTRGLLDRLRKWMKPDAKPAPEAPASDGEHPDTEHPGGEFIAGSFSHQVGTRPYKLFVPAAQAAGPRPLVVMLHGCTQSPDDFAAGTRMNDLAMKQGFLVLYPGQIRKANPNKCWNWFKPEDQARETGEPALLAAMTRDVMARYDVDPRRVYIAGMSAGGAMAALLADTHPELYAAVGIHSGLPVGAAHDVPSAMAAMKGAAASARRVAPSGAAVPTIVFHGDRDTVVHPRNGERVVGDVLSRGPTIGAAPVEAGSTPGGHGYSRTVHRDASGRPVLESWIVHGAGHAWSGGSHAGTYTDPQGPDASEAMLRFFLERR